MLPTAQDYLTWLRPGIASSVGKRVAMAQTAQDYSLSWLDPRMFDASAMAASRDLEIAQVQARVQSLVAVSQRQLNDDVAAIEARNVEIRAVNDRTRPVLKAVTAQDLGDAPEAWTAWWTDQKGYALKTPGPAPKPTFTTFVENPLSPITHNSCFGAGTPVRTLTGPRPIESIRVGDRVLAQDTTTGACTSCRSWPSTTTSPRRPSGSSSATRPSSPPESTASGRRVRGG